MRFDLIVKDGLIFDGARTPRYRSDIGIVDGRIAEIGRASCRERVFVGV